MFPRGADNFLCVLVHLRIVVLLLGILVLRLSETTTNRNRIEFVLADAPIQYFLTACFRIKEPFPFLLHDRNRKREIIITYYESGVTWIFLVYLDGLLRCGEFLLFWLWSRS